MKQSVKKLLLSVCLTPLLFSDFSAQAPLGLQLIPEAAAIIGIPWSPLSFAGVARRTTRRAVVATSSATASASSQQSATAQQQAATAQQQSATAQQQSATAQQQSATAQQQSATAQQQAADAPPIGAIVSSLPAGCVSSPKGGVQYYNCDGVYYRVGFQGNNLVYVVQQP